jgi:hypothetical protein
MDHETPETATCSRCGDRLVPSQSVIGLWLSDREGPGIGEPGQRLGLCPDGEHHEAEDS